MMVSMAEPLPRLRADLDFMPSPMRDRPGLLIRDPFQYSDTTLIIPAPLVECLQHFNGISTELDLRADLVRTTGSLEVSDLMAHLTGTLSNAGFLEDEVYRRLRERRHREFAEALVRVPSHAGSSYPAEARELRGLLDRYLNGVAPPTGGREPIGIAAPHVSLEGGYRMYATAYRAIPRSAGDRVFVILGTSHYGAPDRFGLTRKPFLTPLGEACTEVWLVDRLAERAGVAVEMEDYCHATEHSIEFQVLFLQHLFGPQVRIVPILCGSFGRSLRDGRPEDAASVRAFLGELAELAASHSDSLFWVLGIDLAHMGRRYGGAFTAVANRGVMEEVAARDRSRLERVLAGDAAGFWELLRDNNDDLNWCGSSVLYSFLRAVPAARGKLLGYEQWNIDPQSVVSYAAISFI